MANHPLVPVILSGGAGTRLWPLSRESHPKPFLTLPDGQSLLQKTYQRACQLPGATEVITITNQEYDLKSKAEYEKVNTALPHTLLLEPSARNTAPAILLAALSVADTKGSDAILLVLPADHLISDINAFREAAEQAIKLAEAGKIVTFGIQPTRAETGYGYIEYDLPSPRFIEKPTRELAETYVASGRYLWNAGIFCFKASVLLDACEQHDPALLAAATACHQARQQGKLNPALFNAITAISIDYAIMEKSDNIAVVPCSFDWQDIGSFEAYQKLYPSDANQNTVFGDTILIDSQHNFIHSDHRIVASIGINHLTVVDTPDALLIAQGDRTQEVKDIVQLLKSKAHESYLTHRTVIRPWGSYTVLEEGPCFKIKRIVVNPKASLSLQKHEHRSEHWVVVEGTARVVNGDKDYLLHTNESTFVPIGTQHRLSNPGDTAVVIIEVQTGAYLGEDDIIRLEDTYGRVT